MTAQSQRSTLAGVVLAVSSVVVSIAHAQTVPDLVLTNGKVITVDERFTIAEAVAIRADRIVAVGSNRDIAALATPATRTIDLEGRAAIPGLIDNHMHLLRAGTTWGREVRWDSIESRSKALQMIRDKAAGIPDGEWVFNLGGWTVDQFADDDQPFTREELDAVAPRHPVLLQASYYRGYLNSRALQLLGIDGEQALDASVLRDSHGRPTGEIGEALIRRLAERLPAPTPEQIEASTRSMFADLNRAGLTAFGSAGCDPNLLATYRTWAARGQLDVRVFCITGSGASTPEQVADVRLFGGDDYVDHVAFGESVYGPVHDPMFLADSDYDSAQLAEWRRIATEIAKAGLPLHVHANLRDTLTGFLDQIEAIDKQYPIRNLRWTFAHANQLEPSHLERMQALGMYVAVHPWAVINGGINRSIFGDAAYDMAPLATIQRSGITWGLGSDGSRANQVLPFATLAWAVTGRMVGGDKVLRQTISREDALIAHTRKNAYLIFREDRLGSIQEGKLADLVVLDRDYLTVPEDEIKDITAVLTIVGGRIVFSAL
jgi:predicted amidohydrolase YtcJ